MHDTDAGRRQGRGTPSPRYGRFLARAGSRGGGPSPPPPGRDGPAERLGEGPLLPLPERETDRPDGWRRGWDGFFWTAPERGAHFIIGGCVQLCSQGGTLWRVTAAALSGLGRATGLEKK